MREVGDLLPVALACRRCRLAITIAGRCRRLPPPPAAARARRARRARLPGDERGVDVAADAGAIDRLPFADRFAADFDGLAFTQHREPIGAASAPARQTAPSPSAAGDVGHGDRLAPGFGTAGRPVQARSRRPLARARTHSSRRSRLDPLVGGAVSTHCPWPDRPNPSRRRWLDPLPGAGIDPALLIAGAGSTHWPVAGSTQPLSSRLDPLTRGRINPPSLGVRHRPQPVTHSVAARDSTHSPVARDRPNLVVRGRLDPIFGSRFDPLFVAAAGSTHSPGGRIHPTLGGGLDPFLCCHLGSGFLIRARTPPSAGQRW